MKRSAIATLEADPALFPEVDGPRAVMILGKDNGAAVQLHINALPLEETARLGTGGVYLQIAGVRGTSLASTIAASAKFKDDDVCVYLDDEARKNLAEQLHRYETIQELHVLMARNSAGPTEEARALAALRTRSAPGAGRRSRTTVTRAGE